VYSTAPCKSCAVYALESFPSGNFNIQGVKEVLKQSHTIRPPYGNAISWKNLSSGRVDSSALSTSRSFKAVIAFSVVAAIAVSGCGSLDASGRNAEGVRLYQQSQYDQALRQFQEASYADPTNADAYYNMASTYHRMGKLNNQPADLEKAETYYNLCLDRNNNHADCYRGLAVLLAEQGRTQESFRLVEGWVSQQPTSPGAKIELARLCQEFGDRNAAKEHLVDALSLQPDNARALAALGKIREDSGDTSQALANYQRSYWYDSRQPQIASRISALQTSLNPTITPLGPAAPLTPTVQSEQTQMVNRDPAPLR
jgi:tetratricopeptide (TPR) repeat protein